MSYNNFFAKKVNNGHLASFQTKQSRKNVFIKNESSRSGPLASESFSLDPNEYFELMHSIEEMYKKKLT